MMRACLPRLATACMVAASFAVRLHAQSPTPLVVGGSNVLNSPIVPVALPDPARLAMGLPATGPVYSQASGLRIESETDPAGSFGYARLRIRVEGQAPVAKPRRVHIRFQAGHWRDPQETVVEGEFEVPAGAVSAETSMLLPRFLDWQLCGIQTKIDGQPDPELSFGSAGIIRSGTAPGIAVLTPDWIGLGPATSAFLQSVNAFRGDVEQRTLANFADWPEAWLDYSSYDLVLIDAKGLSDLVAAEPVRAAALAQWVRAGGNLWVTQVGIEWNRIAVVDDFLGGLPNRAKRGASDSARDKETGATVASDASELPAGWLKPPRLRENEAAVDVLLALRGVRSGEAPVDETVLFDRARPDQRFLMRPCGLGLTVAFVNDLPDQNRTRSRSLPNLASQAEMQLLAASPAMGRLDWVGRHGFTPGQSCEEFNNWLVPGVGLAPVTAFQVLITLFVVLVGPVNYWLLARRQKLPLLLATAPAAAFAAIALLFAYGLITDGVGARVRMRSYTELDQRTGQAASWARISYYAGMAPAGGLTMPVDAAVYPMLPRWEVDRRHRGSGQHREVAWVGGQRLSRGWLASRTPTQLLTIAARPTSRRLELREGQRGVQATNLLEVDVASLAIQDHQGRLYWAENLAAGEAVRLEPVEWTVIAPKLRTLFSDNELQFPAGADYNRRNRRYAQKFSTGLLELHLAALTSPMVRGLGNGAYVAVTQGGVEVDHGLPVDAVDDEGSFCVTRGTW